jgi:dGTPase
MSALQKPWMDWNKLLSALRTGQEERPAEPTNDRTQFQRDYDRLVFSSPFRRMQDKTQVFPLPGSVFVHNRLTHSLEVSCVGRSLGNKVARYLTENNIVTTDLVHEIGSVVAAACLAHDMGNPPFGHSGETAISDFFCNGPGKQFETLMKPEEWTDLVHFEGNANAMRVLTHQFNGRRKGGFALTYTTLASIVKYPHASGAITTKSKYGFFQSEANTYRTIANRLGIIETTPGIYARHPLVYLVEAADDICYLLMDIEDAHKLGIVSTEEAKRLFTSFLDLKNNPETKQRIAIVDEEVTDINEQIAFLRAIVIGKLVEAVYQIFIQNQIKILTGEYNKSLVDDLTGVLKVAMKECKDFSVNRIYRHPQVAEIEIAGFKILGYLLNEFTIATLNPDKPFSKLLLTFVPLQFKTSATQSVYNKILSVVDFVSGMTDVYALEIYRKINGMGLNNKSL